MRLFPWRQKKALTTVGGTNPLSWLFSGEWRPFAFQRGEAVSIETALAFDALYACITLIAADIAKLPLRLVELTGDGIWVPAESSAFQPVLRKPNRYQTRIQFLEQWMVSKLTTGNTYVLLERDKRDLVVRMYVLDPACVTVLQADDGEVFYKLNKDRLTGIDDEGVIVPASEVIHDRNCPLFHPLVGISPIYACSLSAQQGLEIQNASKRLFGTGLRPSGLLSVASGNLSREQAERIQQRFMEQYTGANANKIAVVAGDMKFTPLAETAVNAQLVEQLRLSAERVCSAFHVPAYKVGVGPHPTHNNGELLNQAYYSECLQIHIESIESLLDEAMGLDSPKEGRRLGTELDIDVLLRMDSLTRMEVLSKGVGSALYAPDEGRKKLNMPPVPGGKYPYLQQQNYSLDALSRRDAQADPFGSTPEPTEDQPDLEAVRAMAEVFTRDAIRKAMA